MLNVLLIDFVIQDLYLMMSRESGGVRNGVRRARDTQ